MLKVTQHLFSIKIFLEVPHFCVYMQSLYHEGVLTVIIDINHSQY